MSGDILSLLHSDGKLRSLNRYTNWGFFGLAFSVQIITRTDLCNGLNGRFAPLVARLLRHKITIAALVCSLESAKTMRIILPAKLDAQLRKHRNVKLLDLLGKVRLTH